MELDQSLLDSLPRPQRLKLAKQIRQKQIEKYLEFVKNEKQQPISSRKPNKRDTHVFFVDNLLLQDAVERGDETEVKRLINLGTDVNFSTGNGVSLLHKSCATDNQSLTELLISYGAGVNATDDDKWSPLHVACSHDNTEITRLLLQNGADVTHLDVDGNLPLDHTTPESNTYNLLKEHIKLDESNLKRLRQYNYITMLAEIKDYLQNGGNPNLQSGEGITFGYPIKRYTIKWNPMYISVNYANVDIVGTSLLSQFQLFPRLYILLDNDQLHIACANGYRAVTKLLINYKADVNATDDQGWTPLHAAAKFGHVKDVQRLLKYKADPNKVDLSGNKPLDLASTNDLKNILISAGRYGETEIEDEGVKSDEDEKFDDILNFDRITRNSSKTVRPKHLSLSKEDEIYEASSRFQKDNDGTYFDEEEEIYVSTIWRSADYEEAALPSLSPSDNLSTLSEITEQIILERLEERYSYKQIYTYIGDILIAVNPFKQLPYYAKSISDQYNASIEMKQLPPHVYAVADNCYKNMVRDQCSQCCVISGESGSGKTESCKFFLQHILRVAGSEENTLNNKINQVNPLLEAFGNSQTVMNDNSSRFGKYVELNFSKDGVIMGAKIHEYLLEKSRIVSQGKGELNFHIFYWMFAGLSPEESKLLGLEHINNHRYLRGIEIQSPNSLLSSENSQKFIEVKECLKFVGFSHDDIQNLLIILAAVLHIGDISFRASGNNDAAEITNLHKLDTVCKLLQVPYQELSSSLVEEYTVTRGEQIKKERSVTNACDCRDALAKTFYSRLFSWIVNGINQMIQPFEESGAELDIGILDIFGFENFSRNSFEQMCINLTNEQLQAYFNEHIFSVEQEDCLVEGVPLVDVNFTDNQPIIDLFMERHTGVMAVLDEESRFPNATDYTLATKLHQGPGKNYPTYYKTPRDGGITFTIIHYAGAVTYDLTDVLDRNRDTLANSITFTMRTSSNQLVRELFQSKITRTGTLAPSTRQQKSRKMTAVKSPFEFFKRLKQPKADRLQSVKKSGRPMSGYNTDRKVPSTLAYHFKNSLQELLSKINSSKSHFIRCIKPNTKKAGMMFTAGYVLAQLRYTGVLETVRLRKYGYAMRIPFRDFLNRYEALTFCHIPLYSFVSDEHKCREMLNNCHVDGFKVGRTKLFLQQNQIDQLEELTFECNEKIIKIQSAIRTLLAVKQKEKEMIRKKQQQAFVVSRFLQQVEQLPNSLVRFQVDLIQHDAERFKKEQEERLAKDAIAITQSLEVLDSVLNDFDLYSPSPTELSTGGDAFMFPDVSQDENYEIAETEPRIIEDVGYLEMKGMTEQQRGPLPPIPNGSAVNVTGYYPSQGQPISNHVYHQSPTHGQNVNNSMYHHGSPSHGIVSSGGGHNQMSPQHGMYTNSSEQYPNAQSDHMINTQHGAIYEQIHAVENQQTSKKKAPPSLPKRSPSTRLSSRSSSISSTSGLYEELPADQYSDSNGHVQYQQTQSPSGSHPSSPMMKHKVYTTQQNNSPSHQSKPFAYISGATPSPVRKTGYPHNGSPSHSSGTYSDETYGYNRQIRTKSEGAIFSQSALSNPSSPKVMPKPPVVPEKSELISRPKSSPTHAFQSPTPMSFHPVQHTKPPPVASPPPPPHVYQQAPAMHPTSPAMQRPNTAYDQNFNHPAYIQHSDTVTPSSPKYQHRQLPPTKTSDSEANNSKKPIPPPPSFPAPPPPLPLQDRFLGAVQSRRSPSPPLPPPPADFADKQRKPIPPSLSVTQGQTKYQQAGVGDVVPIAVKSPPITNTQQTQPLYNQPNSPPPPPPPSFMPPPPPPAPPLNFQSGTSSFQPKKTSPTKPVNAPHLKTDGQKIKSAIDNTELLAEIGKFQLKKAQTVAKPEGEPQQQHQEQSDETPQTSFLGVLRRTPGGVQVNTVPADESSNPVRTITTSQEAVRDIETVQYNTEDILPPPPPNFIPVDGNSSGDRLGLQSFQSNQVIKSDQIDTGLLTDTFIENMDISDVDPREVPDLTVIPDDCPQWKRNMIEKKNRERIIEYKKKRDEERREQEKWKNVPDWKRKLIEGKQKEKPLDKNSEIDLETQIDSDGFMVESDIPPPPEFDEEYLNSLPPWKRELLLKKKNPTSPGIMEA